MSSTSTTLIPASARQSISSAVSAVSQNIPTPKTAPTTPTSHPNEAKPSPGTFRHPRLAEIVARQNKTILTQSDVRSAAINSTALVLSFVFSNVISNIFTAVLKILAISHDTSNDITTLIFFAGRILFLVNIGLSLRQAVPCVARKDNIEDIPLTPSQRALLGLPPSSKTTPAGSPLAPSTGYITPPRYHRRLSGSASTSAGFDTPTNDPMSADRRSVSANYSASPLSTSRYTLGFSPSPSAPQTQPYNRTGRTASGSPSGSPLFHKAIERQRRQSQDFELGRSTGLGRSNSLKDAAADRGSPLPRARKGVNFKWLYDQNYSFGNGGSRGLASSQSMNF